MFAAILLASSRAPEQCRADAVILLYLRNVILEREFYRSVRGPAPSDYDA
jgi:hypothetical protein